MISNNRPSAEFSDFKLLKMILLDSYSLGGETIVNLDGGTLIVGDNAVGKSSLLSLLSLFYGESPNRCRVGLQDFETFYMRNETSYIIFEYERRGVKCMSIMYSQGNSAYRYRFIQSEYSIKFFTEDDQVTLVNPATLKTNLKTNGIPHSKSVSRPEYRNIIQAHPFGISRKEAIDNRALISQYSFTSSGNQLHHIEKIVTGMFSRSASFSDFLSIIIDYLSQDTEKSSTESMLSADRDIYAQWPINFAAYNAVMAQADTMKIIDAIDLKLCANKEMHTSLLAKLVSLKGYLTIHQDELSKRKIEQSSLLSSEEKSFNADLQSANNRLSEMVGDIKQTSTRISKIEEADLRFNSIDIKKKANDLKLVDELTQQLIVLAKRRAVLVGDADNIDREYHQLKRTSSDLSAAKIDAIKVASEREIDALTPKIEENQAEMRRTIDAIHAQAKSKIAEIHAKERTPAVEMLGEISARTLNPPTNHALEENLLEKQLSVASKQNEINALNETRNKLFDALSDAKYRYKDQVDEITSLSKSLSIARDKFAGIFELINPEEDTLLHFLRLNKPNWTENIAKVINPELMLNQDLSPTFVEGLEDYLYGVSLNLSGIETELSEDENRRQELLIEAQNEVERQERIIQVANEKLVALNKARIQAEKDISEHNAKVSIFDNQISSLKKDEVTAKQAISDYKREAKLAAQKSLDEQRKVIALLDESIKKVQSDADDKARAQSEYFLTKDGDIRNQILSIKAACLDAIEKERAALSAALRLLSLDQSKALSEKGVDEAHLREIDNSDRALRNRIAEISSWMTEVNTWNFWLENEFSQIDDLRSSLKSLIEDHVALNKRTDDAKSAWDARRSALSTKVRELSSALQDNLSQIETATKRCDELSEVYPSLAAIPYDNTWTLSSLIEQLHAAGQEMRSLKTEVADKIKIVKSIMAKVKNSPTEQFYLRERDKIGANDLDPISWIAALKFWFDEDHVGVRNLLLQQAHLYGMNVTGFYEELHKFQSQISKFNREIQSSLNEIMVFKRFTQLNIRFESALDRLKYWDPIKRFSEEFDTWKASDREMPSDDFTNALQVLVNNWSVSEGIIADRTKLINIVGDVVEGGNVKSFKTANDLDKLSSNGLSYLIMCTIFVAFVRKIRGNAKTQITWSIDELLNISPSNIHELINMLRANGIQPLSACPTFVNSDVMDLFENTYEVVKMNDQPYLIQYCAKEGVQHV